MKVVGKLFKVVENIWDIILFVCIIALLLIRYAAVPFGYMPVTCLSNSMAPAFYQGDLCYIDKNYTFDEVEEGDIIAYSLGDGSLVTHRVMEIREDGSLITQGDANEDPDMFPIVEEQLIGENVFQLPFIGELFKEFPNKLFLTLVAFAAGVKLLLYILCKVTEQKDKEKEKDVKKEEADEVVVSTSDITPND